MSAHVLLKLLNELRKAIKCEACTNVRLYLSYDINIILESYFWRKKVNMSLCTQRCYGCHFIHVTVPDNL